MARNGEQQHVVRPRPSALPSSPLPFNFPCLALHAACGGGYALLSQLALRCAALLLPSFVKETRRSASQFPSMLAFANANGISIRSLSSSLSFVHSPPPPPPPPRDHHINFRLPFLRIASSLPLARSFSRSLPASSLLGEIDESAPTNRRRTAAFSDNRERKLHLLFLDLERNPQPETHETATYSFYKYD